VDENGSHTQALKKRMFKYKNMLKNSKTNLIAVPNIILLKKYVLKIFSLHLSYSLFKNNKC